MLSDSPQCPVTARGSSRLPATRKRRCPTTSQNLRGNFTSFFWDAHADLVRDRMALHEDDVSFSSNGSFCDYSYSEGEERGRERRREEQARYCNVKDPRRSLATAGDSGVASSCSGVSSSSSSASSSARSDHSSTLYSQIRSTTRVVRRTQSSSSLGTSDAYDRSMTRGGGRDTVRDTVRYGTVESVRRWERRDEQEESRRGGGGGPQRNTYASASFHHSRVSAVPPVTVEGRYNVKKRRIYEDCAVSAAATLVDAPRPPCCWECFEARVERERVSAGLPTRTAYLPEPAPSENHYENISFDACDAASPTLPATRHTTTHFVPVLPPRSAKPRRAEQDDEEEEEQKSESDTYARLCSIEFSKLRAADSCFSQERLGSLQRKLERLLLVKSDIDLSEKSLSEAAFAKAANQVVYRFERRLRAIEAYSRPQFKKITADLISLLASAEKKQKSKMDTFKRGFARAVKVIF